MKTSRSVHGTAAFLAVLLAACASETSPPATDPAADEMALLTASDALVAAEMAGDTEGAVAHYDSDAVAQPAGMPMVQGVDGMRELYAEFFALPFEFASERADVHLSADGTMAWEYGTNTFTAEDGTTLSGKYLAVWEKVDGVWKVAAISFSEDAPPPPAPADTTTS